MSEAVPMVKKNSGSDCGPSAGRESGVPEPVVIGDCTLYLADCREVLPTLAGVDAVVTDGPYGISHPCNFAARGRGGMAACNDYPDVHDDHEPFDPTPILSLGLPTILWGGNHFASRLPDSSGWLVWDKVRPDDLDQSTCELAWTNCVKGVRRFNHLWNGCMRDSEREENYHPTQKPVALMLWSLSLRWTQGFQSILDPYMGSSPLGVACALTGRRYVGCEINQDYFNIACRRIREAYASQALFRQPDPPSGQQAQLIPTT